MALITKLLPYFIGLSLKESIEVQPVLGQASNHISSSQPVLWSKSKYQMSLSFNGNYPLPGPLSRGLNSCFMGKMPKKQKTLDVRGIGWRKCWSEMVD